jgi:hypothetical protein
MKSETRCSGGGKKSISRRRWNAANAGRKHAKDEFAVLIERDLFRNKNGITLVDNLQKAGFRLLEYSSALGCNAVQFIRNDYSEENAMNMLLTRNQDGFVHLHIVTTRLPKHRFMKRTMTIQT